MEYIAGGELFTYLRTEGKLTPEHAMMYSAQVALMFEYLHSKNIIYRDLKPENILIDNEGYLKLTDFLQLFILVTFVQNSKTFGEADDEFVDE